MTLLEKLGKQLDEKAKAEDGQGGGGGAEMTAEVYEALIDKKFSDFKTQMEALIDKKLTKDNTEKTPEVKEDEPGAEGETE